MIEKTPLGIPFFDNAYGGVYRNRVSLVTGRSGSGKTAVGLHFLSYGLKLQERCLMLSAQPAQDLAIYAGSLGLPVQAAIESGALILLEYNDFVPGRDREESIVLPPDAFLQLKNIIETQVVQRVVIDTVLPWLMLPDEQKVPEHIFSFVRAVERLGATTLFTMLKPVSTGALQLRRLVENILPISISLLHTPPNEEREWLVNKFIGMNPDAEGVKFGIAPGRGIYDLSEPPPVPAPALAGTPRPAAAPPPAARTACPTPVPTGGRGGFADFVLNQVSFRSEPARAADRHGRTPSAPGSSG